MATQQSALLRFEIAGDRREEEVGASVGLDFSVFKR
jgi:hypothetical protein